MSRPLFVLLIEAAGILPTAACPFASRGAPMPDDVTHRHLQSIDSALSSDPGVLPHVVKMAGNGFVSNGLQQTTTLTDSKHLIDSLLDFAETQSEDMCYWSYQTLPPPTGGGPTYWDMQTGQWDNDLDWVRAIGEVAYSRLHSLIEPGGSVVGAMCAMGSEMTKRQCDRGIEADKAKCIPQLLESEITWPMAIAIFKVDGNLLETIRNWRDNPMLHLPNIQWTFGGGSRPEIWNASVPGVGDIDPPGMPHGDPWPTSQGQYWGVAPGQQMIAKVMPCSQIPDKFRYSSELLYCDHIAEGASISTPDEGYAVWGSLVSVWPPTKPCADNISALNSALKNKGMSSAQNCKDGMQLLQGKIPNFSCDTTSMFGDSLFRDLCCSECGGEPIPDMSPPAPAPPPPSSVICAENPGCVAAGLTGNNNCCPTDDGTQLACCEQQSSASCAANAGCVAVGLTGNNNCCPTDDGTQLACCDQMSANPEGLQVV